MATVDVDGANVLLLDDTFTTGARIQNAASALTLAGTNVVAAVPIGRVINPSFNAAAAELWEAARAQPFDFDVCCLDLERFMQVQITLARATSMLHTRTL